MSSYPNYQEVDSYWYGQIPSTWKKTKNKFLFSQKKSIVGEEWDKFILLTMGKSGVKPRDMDAGGKFPESFESYQKVSQNQIVFCLFDMDGTLYDEFLTCYYATELKYLSCSSSSDVR